MNGIIKVVMLAVLFVSPLCAAKTLSERDKLEAKQALKQAIEYRDKGYYADAAGEWDYLYKLTRKENVKYNYFKALYLAHEYDRVFNHGTHYLSQSPKLAHRYKSKLRELVRDSEPRVTSKFGGSLRSAGPSTSTYRSKSKPQKPPLTNIPDAPVTIYDQDHAEEQRLKRQEQAKQARIKRAEQARQRQAGQAKQAQERQARQAEQARQSQASQAKQAQERQARQVEQARREQEQHRADQQRHARNHHDRIESARAMQGKIKGWDVTEVHYSYEQRNGNYISGTFKHTDEHSWIEYGRHLPETIYYTEEGRDEWSVYLYSRQGDISMQLDLHDGAVMYSEGRGKKSFMYYIDQAAAGH